MKRENSLTSEDNILDLAKIIMSEASIGNQTERTIVAQTVLNRMKRNNKEKVKDVWNAYAHNQSPTSEIKGLSRRIFMKEINDISEGATHFYSPRSMPKEGESTTGHDVGGGLEQTPGLDKKNYRPSWSLTFERILNDDVREVYYKFYKAPGNGPVS
jgi:hypothetical protein